MLPYTEGNYEATLSTQTFVRGAYDFPKWFAWGDAKKTKNVKDSKKSGLHKRGKKRNFQKKLLSKCI